MGGGNPKHQNFDRDLLDALSDDQIDAVTDSQRRVVLYYLQERQEASLSRLSSILTGWIAVQERGVATATDYERSRVRLHHRHLPKLADAGLVEYHEDDHRAALLDLSPDVQTLLGEARRLELQQEPEGTSSAELFEQACSRNSPLRPITGLRDTIEAVEDNETTITVYAPELDEELVSQFATRNVDVEHESFQTVPDGFVLVRDDDEVIGSVGLSVLAAESKSSTTPPWKSEQDRSEYRRFLSLFQETLFSTDDRSQLLATTREIEDRAWRTGQGTLRAGFQSLSDFRDQLSVYETLAEDPTLDVHVYCPPDEAPSDVQGITVHEVSDGDIGNVWMVAFEDDSSRNSCALLAEERSPDRYYGFWTYDREFVSELIAYLDSTYE